MKTFIFLFVLILTGIVWVHINYLAVSPAMYEKATSVCKDHGGLVLVIPTENEKVICSSGIIFVNFMEKQK